MTTKYQLFAYRKAAQIGRGIFLGGRHHDLDDVMRVFGLPPLSGSRLDDLLDDWAGHLPALAQVAEALSSAKRDMPELDEPSIEFLPPLDRPGVIYGAGANYRDHVEAMARAFNMKLVLDPKADGVDPWHFIKAGRGTLGAHRETLTFPPHAQKLDWEAELAVVLGRRAHHVSVEDALDHVAGYSCSNDLSARDHLVRQPVDPSSPFRFDWIGHKCFTGACPLGPYLTPGQFVPDPENLGIKLWLNGDLMQDSNTSNHLYSIAEQISYLSHRLDLYPGDVILTGTPAGVGMERGTFLKRGDSMTVWIEGLGELRTTLS
jgi:2-keto-4-pentenoate hydratase/2-oxohepta-3-ene-1,7-dioic acid hydratase in catechol pathway